MKAAEKKRVLREKAIHLHNSAFTYFRERRFDLAWELANEAMEINEEIGRPEAARKNMRLLGRIIAANEIG